jgi:hypothetical protein
VTAAAIVSTAGTVTNVIGGAFFTPNVGSGVGGTYSFTTSQPIEGCALFATLGGNPGAGANQTPELINASAGGPNTVVVNTATRAFGTGTDENFYIEAICP